ncbi:hypothetical protein Ciccas_000514 [Cichlidogyrus casuarinus]|uniref:Uncharacterized protein n=1 Tax=Cichlidogyrus casuarinus TaxID=1844966 RepID=A0ABD2QMN6_9PLAT
MERNERTIFVIVIAWVIGLILVISICILALLWYRLYNKKKLAKPTNIGSLDLVDGKEQVPVTDNKSENGQIVFEKDTVYHVLPSPDTSFVPWTDLDQDVQPKLEERTPTFTNM